jgi:hypothetical protein
MLTELFRSAVFLICLTISLLLVSYLDMVIAKGEEWGDTEGFIIISPFIITMVLFGFFVEKFKTVISYSLLYGFLACLMIYYESFNYIPETQTEPDIIDLALISPFPYLLAIFGIMFLALLFPISIGFILSFTKRKICQ